jgi:hypothetical protein
VKDLNLDLGPALQTSGGVVDVDGMAPVGCVASLGVVHLGLTFPETLKNLPGSSRMNGPLAEQTFVGKKVASSNHLTYQVNFCHSRCYS